MGKTQIEWTEFSVNPIRAENTETQNRGHFCELAGEGCDNCYAGKWNASRRHETMSAGTGLEYVASNRSKVRLYLDESVLQKVIARAKGTKFFWCDMTDMFLRHRPDDWIADCFGVMLGTRRHRHQVLTKRPETLRKFLRHWTWEDCLNHSKRLFKERARRHQEFKQQEVPSWIWVGTSVENQTNVDRRVKQLVQCPAKVRLQEKMSCDCRRSG